jgi:ribokinase
MNQQHPKVIVVGSSNMDLVVKSERIPAVGETILGGDFLMVPGGKGANQAVAAARLGAEVYFIARLGEDIFAEASLNNFRRVGVKTKYINRTSNAPSGVALIAVDDEGNNAIVVAPGANSMLSVEDVQKAESDIANSGAVVAQLEIPIETVEFAAELAHKHKVPFILDPAPARDLSPALLQKVDVLTPNETEAQMLTGVTVEDEKSARAAAEKLLAAGVGSVIITMGSAGYLLAQYGCCDFVQAPMVKAVDSTAAGDAFTGALACGIASGKDVAEAAAFANCVAAVSVTKMGAQPSMPTRKIMEDFKKEAPSCKVPRS